VIRDKAVADLLSRRLGSPDASRCEAATILIEFCRKGMSDREISAALADRRISASVSREIERLTEEIGVALTEAERETIAAVPLLRKGLALRP
jgi:hypothetical protein